MDLGGMMTAIGAIFGVINGLYTFSKNVEDYSMEPTEANHSRTIAIYTELIFMRIDLIRSAEDIAKSIRSLAAHIDMVLFMQFLADKLGDSDAAVQDLDAWRRTGSDGSKALALDRSAGALADTLRYANQGELFDVRPALVYAHAEILAVRCAILAEVDPTFARSSVVRIQMENGIVLIREAMDLLQREIESQRASEWVTEYKVKDRESGDWLYFNTWHIAFHNATGTAGHKEDLGPYERGDIPEAEMKAARDRTAILRRKGMAEDAKAARIQEMRDFAKSIEQCIAHSEMAQLERILVQPMGRVERARYGMLRQSGGPEVALRAIFAPNRPAEEADVKLISVEHLCEILLNRQGTDSEAEVLKVLLERFGAAVILPMLFQDTR